MDTITTTHIENLKSKSLSCLNKLGNSLKSLKIINFAKIRYALEFDALFVSFFLKKNYRK